MLVFLDLFFFFNQCILLPFHYLFDVIVLFACFVQLQSVSLFIYTCILSAIHLSKTETKHRIIKDRGECDQ